MTLAQTGRGSIYKSFRLDEVPKEVRVRAVEVEIARELRNRQGLVGMEALMRAQELRHAAEFPSDKVYVIPRAAWERVMLRKNRRRP